jgi:hypothetical protein
MGPLLSRCVDCVTGVLTLEWGLRLRAGDEPATCTKQSFLAL